MLTRWISWLTAPVDAVGLGAFRVAFGLVMVVQSLVFLGRLGRYLGATFRFPYEGLEWLRPWPGVGMYVHCALMGLLALGVAAGVRARACAAGFGALFAYVVLLDQTHYNNHYYLIVLLAGLLCALRSDAALAPPWRATDGVVPRYHVLLLQLQLVLVYLFAAVAKLNPDWLAGEPLRHWLAVRAAHAPFGGEALADPRLPWLLSYGGLLFDLCVGPALLWRRTRVVALVACGGFHLSNAALFEIGVFPWLMLGSLTLFVEPTTLRRLLRLRDAAPPVGARPARRGWAVVGVALAAAYLAVQVVVPLRHWAYPGDVAWSEEGHRFAWRMKLRSKQVHLSLRAREPATGREWTVDLRRWLTPKQIAEASVRPLLVWQVARRVREDLEAERGQRVEVRARARGSLNFRAHEQDLIDPRVDLSRVEYRPFEAAPWIVPLDPRHYASPLRPLVVPEGVAFLERR